MSKLVMVKAAGFDTEYTCAGEFTTCTSYRKSASVAWFTGEGTYTPCTGDFYPGDNVSWMAYTEPTKGRTSSWDEVW